MKKQNIVYAYQDDKIVSIKEVSNGLSCNCKCPSCGEPLIARQGKLREWHFAHITAECTYGYQTSLHLMAKQILSKTKTIWVPPVVSMLGDVTNWQQITIDNVYLEKSEGSVIPDIIIESAGKKFFIEIYVTHKVSVEKQLRIRQLGISTLEIDLSHIDRDISEDMLTSLLLYRNNCKYWVFNKVAHSINQSIVSQSKKLYNDINDKEQIFCPIGKRINKGKKLVAFKYDCETCKFNLFNNRYFKYYVKKEEKFLDTLLALGKISTDDLKNTNLFNSAFIDFGHNNSVYYCLGEQLLIEGSDYNLSLTERQIKYKRLINTYDKYIYRNICPMCGGKLIKKYNMYTKEWFIGCSNFNQTGCNFALNDDRAKRIKQLYREKYK